jgi:hypothetical protein
MRIQVAMFVMFAGACMFASGCMSATSDPLPRRSVHVRGTVQSLTGPMLTVATATGLVPVHLLPPSRVSVVVASDRSHLKDGSYLGITSIIQPDGSLRAAEIHIFPAGALRSGEGSYAWDLSNLDAGGTKMTNGTTSHFAARAQLTYPGVHGGKGDELRSVRSDERRQEGGTSLTLQFKSTDMTSLQALTIPWDVPIVTFEPGRTWDLKPGAHVLVIATLKPDGDLCVDRILVGKNGLVPSL